MIALAKSKDCLYSKQSLKQARQVHSYSWYIVYNYVSIQAILTDANSPSRVLPRNFERW